MASRKRRRRISLRELAAIEARIERERERGFTPPRGWGEGEEKRWKRSKSSLGKGRSKTRRAGRPSVRKVSIQSGHGLRTKKKERLRSKAKSTRKRSGIKQPLLPTTFKELKEVDSELAELWDIEETDVWNMFLATGVLR